MSVPTPMIGPPQAPSSVQDADIVPVPVPIPPMRTLEGSGGAAAQGHIATFAKLGMASMGLFEIRGVWGNSTATPRPQEEDGPAVTDLPAETASTQQDEFLQAKSLSPVSPAANPAAPFAFRPWDFRELTPRFKRYYYGLSPRLAGSVGAGVDIVPPQQQQQQQSQPSHFTSAIRSLGFRPPPDPRCNVADTGGGEDIDDGSGLLPPAEHAADEDDMDMDTDFFLDPIRRYLTRKLRPQRSVGELSVTSTASGSGEAEERPPLSPGEGVAVAFAMQPVLETVPENAEEAGVREEREGAALKVKDGGLKGLSNPSLNSLLSDGHLALNPNSYPTCMLVSIVKVDLGGKPRPLSFRVVYRGRKLKPLNEVASMGTGNLPPFVGNFVFGPPTNVHDFTNEVYETGLTFHSILFDYLKHKFKDRKQIDVHDRTALINTHMGRARIHLKDLGNLSGSVVQTFPLHPRRYTIHEEPSVLGHITLSFDFSCSVSDDGQADMDDPIGPDDSASIMGDLGDPELGSNFGSQVSSRAEGELVVEEFIGYFSAAEHTNSSSQHTNHMNHQQHQPGHHHATTFHRHAPPPPQQHTIQYANTLPVFGSPPATRFGSATTAATRLRFEPKRPYTISPRTWTGVKELSNISAAFFNQGWRVSKVDFARAMLLVARWQAKPSPAAIEEPPVLVEDSEEVRVAIHFMRFAVATYGSVVGNYWEAGKGYIRDFLKKGDQVTARNHLGILQGEMLEWEFAGAMETFKPKFFVCWDTKTEGVVVCIRGTVNIHDLVTDMCAEYEPFKNGYAHRGILRCALWLEEHLLPKLKVHIQSCKARALYIVGHSLGAAIGSILTMRIRENPTALAELQQTALDAGGVDSLDAFRLHCFSFACPPCVSADLAEAQVGWVDSFVNENDMVPRLSYGSMIDLRETIIKAADLMRTKMSEVGLFHYLPVSSSVQG
ncbi:hypothetical protein HK101_000644 [Irineochytrium annulatum]|nr:hypothetical protein HK101_000644 [Irineochytrium annulatum]